MPLKDSNDLAKATKLAALYNIVPNVFWSALCLTPITVFCHSQFTIPYLITLIAISLISVLLPESLWGRWLLGMPVLFYKKSGVTVIKRFTQNGDIINALVRKKYPSYKVYDSGKKKTFSTNSVMFLKFHFIMFVFFMSVMIQALISGYMGWACIVFITNVIYNVYPILLQYYNTIRVVNFTRHKNNHHTI